jgi:DNA-directed RNA polymerase specialized sigma24 family protein
VGPPGPFDEEAVRILLIGDDEEVDRGLVLIDQHLRNRIVGWLRRGFPGMAPDDLADAWGETLVGILRLARERRFDGDRPLIPLLCKIAYARATDHTRRRTSRDDVLAAVGEMLRATQAGRRWQRLDPAERNEFMALIRDAIATLPGKQKEVFQAFIDGYPETRSREVLRERVSEATGREETLVSVKRALQEGRAKVGEFLRRKGYDFERRGDE